ncbi:hypothetical protein AG1IA_02600 [Rhizoctonia solani AG-1 IA]|uniref:Uncharacterized protein n=1 Tax=Thanatephorus cucumeris (strain AG1-IA) TaxID=983506 RepID=L8WZ63_THACA|nr:hypothetical protein AG1IA_02600 [Rhizoctonia solani AG-1 IA]
MIDGFERVRSRPEFVTSCHLPRDLEHRSVFLLHKYGSSSVIMLIISKTRSLLTPLGPTKCGPQHFLSTLQCTGSYHLAHLEEPVD